MVMSPRLDLRQSQSLVMTPQLQQAIKLLALSNLEIETFVGEALEANPLLDVAADTPESETSPGDLDVRRTSPESSGADRLIAEGRGSEDRPVEAANNEGDRESDTGDGARPRDGEWSSAFGQATDEDDWSLENKLSAPHSLADHLTAQIGAACDDRQLRAVAVFVVGLLDEAGYLPITPLEIAIEAGVSQAEVERAIALVQDCEPCGVGAADLAQCIALQAREADRYDPAMARLIDNLDLVAKGDFARLRRICQVDEEDLRDMLGELRRYDPKPGLRFGSDTAAPVTPDILLTPAGDGGWAIELNQETLPRLIVNRAYYTELRGHCEDKGSRSWLAERLTDANWLVKALDQRQRTILKVAREIVRQQAGFFREGVKELRPLTLREVAEAIDMHESTISRVTSNKYLQCERGTFELKYFFGSGVAAAGAEGGAAAEAVKAAIRQLVDAEDPKAILSDDALVDRLKGEGFTLARRTVAKYRESIGLGNSVQRRRQKALANV